jgi:hypothetical protein
MTGFNLKDKFSHRLTSIDTQQPSQHHKQNKKYRAELECIPPQRRRVHICPAAHIERQKAESDKDRGHNWDYPAMDLQVPPAGWAAKKSPPSRLEEGSSKT